MNRNFSLFDVIVLAGVIQGFVTTGIIWMAKNRSVSKLILSLVLSVFNLLCLKILIHTTGLWQTHLLRYFPLPFELAIQPLIWLYVTSLIKPRFKFKKEYFLHFLPFLLSFVYSLFVYFTVAASKNLAVKDLIANNLYFNQFKEIEDYLSIISSLIYWFLGLRGVLEYRQWLYNTISNTDFPTYTWLRNVIILMGILIACLAIAIMLDQIFVFATLHFLHWQIFFLYLAFLIYYLGYKGFYLVGSQIPVEPQDHLPKTLAVNNNLPMESGIDQDAREQPWQLTELLERATKVSPEKSQQIKQQVLKALEQDELFLDPELSLLKLANKLNLSPATVSEVINSELKKSFRTLINEYRIEKVKQKLANSKAYQFSILGIALECGFNSEASFYRIFKAAEGVSPKEYIKRRGF